MSERGQIATWIAEAQRGDRLALAKLMAAYGPALRRRAEARVDRAIKAKIGADDLLQEVYVDVTRRIDRFEDRGPDSFLHWLQAILDQKLTDAQRALHRGVRDIGREVPAERLAADSYWSLLDNLYADSTTPSRVVRRDEALSAVLTCIADLPELQRKVIQMRCLDGLPAEEVAKRLGKSKPAVNGLYRRALDALRQAMHRMGEFTRGQ